MAKNDPRISKAKKQVMESVIDKVSWRDKIDTSATDQHFFDQLINEMRSDQVSQILALERMLGRSLTRDDLKDESYSYDQRSSIFADTRHQQHYRILQKAIYQNYISKIRSLIDSNDSSSLKKYGMRVKKARTADNADQFERSIQDISDMIQYKNIKLKKGQTLSSIQISNQDIQQYLTSNKLIKPWELQSQIHHINQIWSSPALQDLEQVIQTHIRQSANRASQQADLIVHQVESCFVLPSLGDVLDSYQPSIIQIVQWWMPNVSTFEKWIQSHHIDPRLQATLQEFQTHHDLSKLTLDQQEDLSTWIYEQLSAWEHLHGVLNHVMTIDPLVWSWLIWIVQHGDTHTLSIDQKQAILGKMKKIRFTPHTQKQLNNLMWINSTLYQKFVDQVLDLKTMKVWLWSTQATNQYSLNFKSKDLRVNDPQTIHTIQDLANVNLDFSCSLWEDFEPIYQHRVGNQIQGKHHKPAFFTRQWYQLQQGDLISIKWADGKVYSWYPQLYQSPNLAKLRRQAQNGQPPITEDTLNQQVRLDLYQDPPTVIPRKLLLSIPSTDAEKYQRDTEKKEWFRREFHLAGAHDLKWLLLLFPIFTQADTLTQEQIDEAFGNYQGQNFVSQFKKNTEADNNLMHSKNPLMTQIMSAYQDIDQTPSPAQTIKDHLNQEPYPHHLISTSLWYLLYALDHQLLYPQWILLQDGKRIDKILWKSHQPWYQKHYNTLLDQYNQNPTTDHLKALNTAEIDHLCHIFDNNRKLDNVWPSIKSKIIKWLVDYQISSKWWDKQHISENKESSKTSDIEHNLGKYEQFCKEWSKLWWDQNIVEPRLGDTLYFGYGESALPKITWYAFNNEDKIGRGHSFWTRFEIVDIDKEQWIIKGVINWVEQSMGNTEGQIMEIKMTPEYLNQLKTNFPWGIIKLPQGWNFMDMIELSLSDPWNTLPKHFKSNSGRWVKNSKEWIQSNISWSSKTIDLKNWKKKRYMGKDAHDKKKKNLPEQWDKIEYFGVTEQVHDAKGRLKYTALMYKVKPSAKWVSVSMEYPKYEKFMSWDSFLVFIMDKWLKPFHQQDIEAIKNKVDIIDMEIDEDEPWKWPKKTGNITGFAPIDTHPSLNPLSNKLGRWVSRNNITGAVKKLRHDMEHHMHHASDFRQKRVEYLILQHSLWSKLGKIRPPIWHIFSEMEGEGSFWALDEAITEQIKHGKAELDAKVNASAKARQVMEILNHWSHLTKPSRYQPDRERLKICGYLLRCFENGGPYNREMKKIAPKDGKRVAAILWKEHLELYKKHFDQRKLEREENPNAQTLNSLNMAEMDYIWRVIDSDEEQKLIFWSSFKSMLENGYKNDGYKKASNIEQWKEKMSALNEFERVYEWLKNDRIAKDLFESFMGGMWHAAMLIKNGWNKTDQFNKWSGLLLASMFSGRTLFRGDDFSQTHHFWKMGRDFGIHPITAQMLIDKKTGGSECIGHIFDKICQVEGIQPPFTQATKRDRSRLWPGIPHAERITYMNEFIQRRWRYADKIMPYMSLTNTDQKGKNLLEMQDDPYIKNYINTFLREDKSPVDIDAKRHVDPTVFNYRRNAVWSFPKGMFITQLLKFDARWWFKWSAGEQNSSYFWDHFWQNIESIWSSNMNQHIYDFVLKKIFICMGERFDGQSKATFLNALRLLKLWGEANIELARKLLRVAVRINFEQRLQWSMPAPVEETLRKFENFVLQHSNEYCNDDLVETIFHYDTTDSDSVESYISRAEPKTQWFYTPEYYIRKYEFWPKQISVLQTEAEKNLHEALNIYEAKKSGILTVNQADQELKEILWTRISDTTPAQLWSAMKRGLNHTQKPWPDQTNIHDATHRNLDKDIVWPTQHKTKEVIST